MPRTPLEQRLRHHVATLAGEIGPRGLFAPERLDAAERYIANQLSGMGYTVTREPVHAADGLSHNLVVERPGNDAGGGVYLAGAHYDSVATTPASMT